MKKNRFSIKCHNSFRLGRFSDFHILLGWGKSIVKFDEMIGVGTPIENQ